MAELKSYSISLDIEGGKLNENKLFEEVENSGFIDVLTGITRPKNSDIFKVHGYQITNEAGLNALVFGHIAETLEELKAKKSKEIDEKTGQLIALGYSFKGLSFSLSMNAQTNILALYTTRDHPALIYPIHYNTIDDKNTYDVLDSQDLENMYLTALATKKAHTDSGTLLKDQVRAAANSQELDAIIDNR